MSRRNVAAIASPAENTEDTVRASSTPELASGAVATLSTPASASPTAEPSEPSSETEPSDSEPSDSEPSSEVVAAAADDVSSSELDIAAVCTQHTPQQKQKQNKNKNKDCGRHVRKTLKQCFSLLSLTKLTFAQLNAPKQRIKR